MSDAHKQFDKKSKTITSDTTATGILAYNINQYNQAVKNNSSSYSNYTLTSNRATQLKQKAVNNLEKYLLEFESKFQSNGGQVIYATDAQNALKEILSIIEKEHATTVVKTTSLIAEELELNSFLSQQNISVSETSLSSFILQQTKQQPYHITFPTINMNQEKIVSLFAKQFNTDEEASPEELTEFTRNHLRKHFFNANIGITGANFLIADIGGIALTENEGNGLMTVSYPKTHIVIAGIEKLISSVKNLNTLWPLLAHNSSGQHITTYNSLITGPKKEQECDGPEKMYVIILNNNRDKILEDLTQREALRCIQCGACLNVCPVYKTVGGHTYDVPYPGPIGAVIMPLIKGLKNYNHLSFACTTCGKCSKICPVQIPLHRLILRNRALTTEQHLQSSFWRNSMWGIRKVFLNNWIIDLAPNGIKNRALKAFARKQWGHNRALPSFAPESFKQLWEKRSAGKL